MGAVGAVLYMRHGSKIKPMAAKLLAKSMRLREKAFACAVKTKVEAEEILTEARLINDTAVQTDT